MISSVKKFDKVTGWLYDVTYQQYSTVQYNTIQYRTEQLRSRSHMVGLTREHRDGDLGVDGTSGK
jgi:hypothetical protein